LSFEDVNATITANIIPKMMNIITAGGPGSPNGEKPTLVAKLANTGAVTQWMMLSQRFQLFNGSDLFTTGIVSTRKNVTGN
jgi:hypothetical protein